MIEPAVVVWAGSAAPRRSIRWLDGAIATAGQFGKATVVAAGDPTWLDLAADRANRAGHASAGISCELRLDYLGWAQVVAALVRKLAGTIAGPLAGDQGPMIVIVDEASRPERLAEVAALAELLDMSQLTQVVTLRRADDLHATRVSDGTLVTYRVQPPIVLGVRIAGPPIDDYPTPVPSAGMQRYDLAALGLDAGVLGHRALPPRLPLAPRESASGIAEYLAVHRVARSEP